MKRKMETSGETDKVLEAGFPRIFSFEPEAIFAGEKQILDPLQLSMISFGNEMEYKSTLSFDAHSLLDQNLMIDGSGAFQPFSLTGPNGFMQSTSMDPSVVPAAPSPKEEDPLKHESAVSPNPHRLRPNRKGPKFTEISEILTSDDDDEEYKGVDHEGKRKKRPYYRKTDYPAEFLEKVEQERLEKKRIKNRELAAKSRQKKKQKMSQLENENLKLKQTVESLREELNGCKEDIKKLEAREAINDYSR